MILHTLDRAHEADCFDRIICATDSEEIASLVVSEGYEAYISKRECITGSDRVLEAAEALQLNAIINLQGDEPVVDPLLFPVLCESLRTYPHGWVTAAVPLQEQFLDVPSVVKVMIDENGFATDFLRLPECKKSKMYKHKGIYGFTLKTLQNFSASPQSDAEKLLSLEQLRIFPETKIKVELVEHESHSVDIPEDIAIVENIFAKRYAQLVTQ